jgi:cytochrome c oxidase cbb3-type subunit 4
MQLDPTYAAVAHFAQTWGLAYFVAVFLAVVAYVLWPSRRKKFDRAAQIPLRED